MWWTDRRSIILRKRGIRKVVTGGRIEEIFEIKETEEGKQVTARKVFEDEEVKARGDSKDSARTRR